MCIDATLRNGQGPITNLPQLKITRKQREQRASQKKRRQGNDRRGAISALRVSQRYASQSTLLDSFPASQCNYFIYTTSLLNTNMTKTKINQPQDPTPALAATNNDRDNSCADLASADSTAAPGYSNDNASTDSTSADHNSAESLSTDNIFAQDVGKPYTTLIACNGKVEAPPTLIH